MDSVRARNTQTQSTPLAITVIGASGDLAKKKTFPAIFSLFYHDLLPRDFVVFGYARRAMSDEEFREMILGTLSCRVIDGRKCAEKMKEFLPRCHYRRGGYGEKEGFMMLDREIEKEMKGLVEENGVAVDGNGVKMVNRLFYLAVPPSVFEQAAVSISESARAKGGWTRLVVEKPFGKDSESYAKLSATLRSVLTEDETYRIDHYLGKELVQNLMTLRFANAIFEPIWNRNHIKSVQIIFKENFGVEGRAGYFDSIGIIRDIMQNHLLQVLALLAMEAPVSLHAEDIRDEKVKLLRSMQVLSPDDFAIGQYGRKGNRKGYLEDEGVDKESRTPTFAACVIKVNNARWAGVPFLMKAGKALDERKAEIRIQFKSVPGGIFETPAEAENNELVIRVQPDEAIYMRILSKMPGLTSRLQEARLNLFYRQAWEESKDIPDAYERLILDVIQGEKSLFIRDDELEVAWAKFTPALKEIEANPIYKPEIYEYHSRGPREAEYLAAKCGVTWSEG